MATIVHFDRTALSGSKIFRTDNNESLFITSFEKEIAYVTPAIGSYIDSFAEIIAGCFEEDSNFTDVLISTFNHTDSGALVGIQFTFNGSTFLVNKENASKNTICTEWLSTIVKRKG